MENILIIGGARSGIAAARLLRAHGCAVTLTDSREVKEKSELESLGVRVADGGHPDWLLHEDWSYVVKNPGIPYRVAIVKHFVEKGVPVYTEVEIGYRYAKHFRYGAVTGTNGKTTITSLLLEMLKRKGKALAAGNIGIPLCEQVYAHEEEEMDVAIELSNFQLLGMETFRPCVSVVCNLAPDHLDYMDSLEAYYQSKMRIYQNCKADDWFLRNVDDPLILQYATDIPCRVIDYSLTRTDVDLYRKDGKVWFGDTMLFDTSTLKIVGDYNVANAMAAACMAYRMGVSLEDIQAACASFTSVEHRLEFIDERDGVRYYNDSKATNTHAAAAALRSFASNVILLAGGHDKGIPFDDLRCFDDRVKLCVAFGETRAQFKDVFSRCVCVTTMEEALDEAIKNSAPGDVILLSPACSSFDQFKNYEERGRIFKEMVRERLAKGA